MSIFAKLFNFLFGKKEIDLTDIANMFAEDIVEDVEDKEEPVNVYVEVEDKQEQPFGWGEVTWLNGCDISKWAVTSTLNVSLCHNKIILDYGAKGSYPPIKYGSGLVSANAWVFVHYQGRWYGSTFEWMRPNQTVKLKKAVAGSHIKMKPLKNWKPQVNDELFFCVSGLARGGKRNTEQRTDVKRLVWR